MKWITATDLALWADRLDAQSKLPELLRRLIVASIDRIDKIRFPSGESTALPGWDGYLFCSEDVPPFVPVGASVWELSTEKDVPRKALDDFEKRSGPSGRALPSGFDYSQTTYVAVTLRRWPEPKKKQERSRDGFIDYGRSLNKWADIKVIDADDLELWLEQCPSVAAWLVEIAVVGSTPPTVLCLDKVWHNWRHRSSPPTNESLLLSERETQVKSLVEALIGAPKILHVKADSPDEAQAFIIAAIEALPNGDLLKLDILARTIIVRDEETAFRLPSGDKKRLILLLHDNAKKHAGGLLARNHTIIVPVGNSDRGKQPDIVLKRQSRKAFAKGLESLGLTPDIAEIQARHCSCSVTVFQRRFPSSTIERPSWASDEKLRMLIPAVLAGAWTEKSKADTKILSSLSERAYDDYVATIHQFLSVDDPPITRAGDVWILTAPADAFALSEHLITPQDLTRLEKCVREVFSEIDPSIDLEPKELPFAGLHGKTLQNSSWFRDGLAQTLLLIAVIGNKLTFPAGLDQQTYVNSLIRQLPGLKTDPRLLVSLRDQIPVLVEAAPGPFVEALEALLQGNDRIAQIIFTDKDSSLFGDCRHAGILWALEGLAWDPEWLSCACLILVRLAEIDPSGTYSNRPIRSLREIFLPWHPSTNATYIQRLQIIDLIIRRSPKIGWNLLTSIFPTFQDISHPTYESLWRESSLSQREVVTRQIVFETYDGIITRALGLVGHDLDRWKIIIDDLSNFSPEHRDRVYDLLESLSNTELSDSAKLTLWNLLRKHVNRHLAFRDSQWALPEDELNRVEKIIAILEPSDPHARFKWLFDEYFPELPIHKFDHDAVSSELNSLRNQAIKEIIQYSGIDGLLEFVASIAFPGMVAAPLVDYVTVIDDLLDILEIALSRNQNSKFLAKCMSSLALEKYGHEWKEKLLDRAVLKKWNDETIATTILDWPDDSVTFSLVSSLGGEVDRLYWSHRMAWIRNRTQDICTFAIRKLMSVNRTLDAIHLAENCSKQLESTILLEVLDFALKELNESTQKSLPSLFDYHIEQIIETLRNRHDVARTEVARREYSFLPLLVHYGTRKDLVLHQILASDPSFFVEVLCDVYKPSSGESEEIIDDNRKLRAEFGYRLLESWQVLPGVSPDGTLDSGGLRNWVLKVRELATQKDRTVITDKEIGKLFAHAPTDPDDEAWPHQAVRELLEELSSDEIEQGISIEQFNKRGVVTKAMFEGGQQERELAEQWRRWAATVGSRWHRTAALLRMISDSWERYAKQEDERAEQDRLKFR